MTELVIPDALAKALDVWEAQCLRRGIRQDGERWQEDDAVTGEGRWVPNMRPTPADRELPTVAATAAVERECAIAAALAGVSPTELRRQLALSRVARFPGGPA